MSLDVTQNKIRRLLEELRSWAPDEDRHTLRELQGMFGLEIFVIAEIARSEGFDLPVGDASAAGNLPEPEIDPDASTIDLDPDAIMAAVEEPDPDPSYEDRDTGIWRKKPTGEWELVDGKERKTDD